jgi:hypothetical protein
MAGDWIKWTKGLTRKPEVIGIAARLGLSRRETAAVLMEIWEWADEITSDGNVPGVTFVTLDALSNVTGIGNAMIDVGWLVDLGDGIVFPNFGRHNGNSAKKRGQAQRRMAKMRQRNAESVTSVTPVLR